MDAAYFVIAILGCADGSQSCTRVTTMPVQYADQQSCAASVQAALAANTDLDFPNLVAECQPVSQRQAAAARKGKPIVVSAAARRS